MKAERKRQRDRERERERHSYTHTHTHIHTFTHAHRPTGVMIFHQRTEGMMREKITEWAVNVM